MFTPEKALVSVPYQGIVYAVEPVQVVSLAGIIRSHRHEKPFLVWIGYEKIRVTREKERIDQGTALKVDHIYDIRIAIDGVKLVKARYDGKLSRPAADVDRIDHCEMTHQAVRH